MTILERWDKGIPDGIQEETIFVIIDELGNYGGFDGWWNVIDDEIKGGILEDLIDLLEG